MTRTRSYKNDLLKALSDPVEAKEYLNAALEDENPEVFLLALRDVVEANLIISKSAPTTNCDRDLYKISASNSQLNNVRSILNQIGLKLAIEVD